MKEAAIKSGPVPVKEGLFALENGRAYLLGNRCSQCGRLYFPSRPFCFECFGEELHEVRLGSEGTLYSYTISYMPSSHLAPPYTVGWISVEEGIRVFSALMVEQVQTLKIGMPMRLVIDELWQEKDRTVVGYKYSPR